MPLTLPSLDDRSFEELVREATARIPVHTPEWTNFNDSDPGMTLVQLFAFMADNLLYRSNRVPEKNRLKFLSLLGIPLQPATPGVGLVVIHNERGPVTPYDLPQGTELRAGKVPFLTSTEVNVLPVSAAVYYKMPRNDVDAATLAQYKNLYATELATGTETLAFYRSMPLEAPETGKPLPEINLSSTEDTIDQSLWIALIAPKNVPVDTVRAAIAGQTLCLGVYPATDLDEGRVLPPKSARDDAPPDPGLVIEIAAPDLSSPAELPPPNYKPLPIEYAENVLEQPGVIWVTLPAYDDLVLWDFDPTEEGIRDYPPAIEDSALAARVVTWLRLRRPQENGAKKSGAKKKVAAIGGAPSSVRLAWVGVNAARVIQALPVVNERLGIATGAPNQQYKVAQTPVVGGLLTTTAPWLQPESTFVLEVQNDRGGWDAWQRTDDLYAHGPDDPVFSLDPESGVVGFGDGLRGRRPPLGREIRASYQYGGGTQGNVAIGAINKSAALPGGFKVENPVRTWGASAGQSVPEGERSITHHLRNRDRLVTAEDFVEIARRTPGAEIGRVEVLPLFNPDQFSTTAPNQQWPGAVTLVVIPLAGEPPEPDRLLLDTVCDWLDPRRLVTTELFVRGPKYVYVWVTVGLVTMPGAMRATVHRAVQAALRDYLSPLTGGPAALRRCDGEETFSTVGQVEAGWPLWTEVRQQDLEAVAVRVEGVRYVNGVKLGMLASDGVTITPAESVPILGVQLPWLAAISVAEGDPPALDSFSGTESARGFQVPVPLQPKTCL